MRRNTTGVNPKMSLMRKQWKMMMFGNVDLDEPLTKALAGNNLQTSNAEPPRFIGIPEDKEGEGDDVTIARQSNTTIPLDQVVEGPSTDAFHLQNPAVAQGSRDRGKTPTPPDVSEDTQDIHSVPASDISASAQDIQEIEDEAVEANLRDESVLEWWKKTNGGNAFSFCVL
jgi:hypothetical protein